jgi:type IV secretory pathway VirJ component
MKRSSLASSLAVLLLALCLITPACAKPEKPPEKLSFGVFGEVLIYRNADEPGRAVLLLSEGAWDERMDKAARTIADMDATVVGIDTVRLITPLRAKADGCFYQAWEFEGLSKIVQKTLNFKGYHLPVLAGFGEGAAVAYATFAQAPKETFAGAITLGFSPRLAIGKPFCAANGFTFDNATGAAPGVVMKPVAKPFGALVLIQGDKDDIFSPSEAKSFASQIPGARVVALTSQGRAFTEPGQWRAAFQETLSAIVPAAARSGKGPSTADASDLPLVELPAEHPGKTLAVIVTGDGGWAGIDQQIGAILAEHGVSVVGFNSLKYFWNKREADEMARDLERTLAHYAAKWGAERFIVVGYSIGADVMPFMAGRMSAPTRDHLALVAMLGPGTHTEFEFRLSNWLTEENRPEGHAMIPEMPKLAKTPVLLVCGTEEEGTLCQNYKAPNVKNLILPGGHHFNKEYSQIALTILREAGIPVQD